MTTIDYAPQGGAEIILALDARVRTSRMGIQTRLEESAMLVYEATRMWFDSAGEGTWPKLAESTVQKKTAQGMMEPARPLYAEGNLYESVISRSGPYSFFIPWPDAVIFGVHWNKDGHEIADVLAGGADSSGVGGHTRIPARPIWPPVTSAIGRTLVGKIGHIMAGMANPPAWPGANVSRGLSGRFVPLGSYISSTHA